MYYSHILQISCDTHWKQLYEVHKCKLTSLCVKLCSVSECGYLFYAFIDREVFEVFVWISLYKAEVHYTCECELYSVCFDVHIAIYR